MEKASGAEKSVSKEVKKAASNMPTMPPGVPLEISKAHSVTVSSNGSTVAPVLPVQPEPLISVVKQPATPLMLLTPVRSSMEEMKPSLTKTKTNVSNGAPPPSLLQTVVPPIVASLLPPGPVSTVVTSNSMNMLTPSDAVIARCHSCAEKCQVIVSQLSYACRTRQLVEHRYAIIAIISYV
jgi:hypothetical protein